MNPKIKLDALRPWETFKLDGIRYTVILIPLCSTRPTILCRNEDTQEMKELNRKAMVRRA
jgi:hypothetical protein